MDGENSKVLQQDQLRQEMKDNSAVVVGALNDQWITLQLLSGKIPTGMDTHSQFFADMLGQLASQSGLSSEQLAQSQHYDAAMLENAALSALTLDILSSNVKGIVDKMEGLVKCGGDISTSVEALAQMSGNGGDSVNGAASTLFGGIGALGTVGDAGGKLSKLGTTMGFAGKAVGLLGGFLSGPVAPLLLGGVALAGVGTIAYKAYKNHKAKQADAADPEFEKKVMEATSYENRPYQPSMREEPFPVTEREIMDPDSIQIRRTGRDSTTLTGAEDDMFAPRQTPPPEESRPTAENAAQHGRLELADAGLIAEISGLRQEIRKLADKPFDPNVRAEVVIKSLRTNMTYPEFEEAIERKFMNDLQVSSMPMW